MEKVLVFLLLSFIVTVINCGIQTKIVGHRGDSVNAPENTEAAFLFCLIEGCDGFETDLRTTKDGYVVLLHDATLSRTTNCTGKVNDYTLSELGNCDAGSWFGTDFAGAKIPTFEQAVELVVDFGDVLLDKVSMKWFISKHLPMLLDEKRIFMDEYLIELRKALMENQLKNKILHNNRIYHNTTSIQIEITASSKFIVMDLKENDQTRGLLGEKISPIIIQNEFETQAVCSCWDVNQIENMQEYLPSSPKQHLGSLLTLDVDNSYFLKWINLHVNGFSYSSVTVKETFINFSHSKLLSVFVWTVNDENTMRQYSLLGVDGIITDNTRLGVSVVNSINSCFNYYCPA
eukprot:TRINITY_DN594_c0_g1_i3.p1 TRINITY_DN594_c0_g1~~TRINITY_DN594_c0_g1_i3.p1  ORF type:complete len:376 (-),score=96.10 TRINITY_DN594_c0_g1_i3:93-1130(-)